MATPFVDIHAHRGELIVALGERVVLCRGLHPWSAEQVAEIAPLELSDTGAIGEIGLDFACTVDRDSQQRLFDAQLSVAQRRQLPVVIHCVRAYNQVLATLEGYQLPAVIFHSFVGSPQLSEQITCRGYYISISPASLRSPKTVAALLKTPLNRVLLESDTAPEGALLQLYEDVAALLGLDTQALAQITDSNFKDIFH